MTLSQNFYDFLCQKYPALRADNLRESIAPNLLSPFTIQLPEKIKTSVMQIIEACQALRDFAPYQEWMAKKWGPQFNPGNNSLFMSYDFHVTRENELKLIEINTNASFLGLGWEMNQFLKLPWNADFKIEDLKKCFENEHCLAGITNPLKKIVITDEQPQLQKMYVEFTLYRELFKSWGYDCDVADIEESDKLKSAQVIYNRSTDFYFETEKTKFLKSLYENKIAAVSPQPYEYRLLADKENFVDWSQESFWTEIGFPEHYKKIIQKALLKTRVMSAVNKEEIWSEKKNLFFKPKRAYGSRMTYKGGSIARKNFELLIEQESIAQELAPPSELEFEMPTGKQSFKYDLRCFAYRNQYQGTVGRLYQGQLTNLRTEGGGFTPVLFQN